MSVYSCSICLRFHKRNTSITFPSFRYNCQNWYNMNNIYHSPSACQNSTFIITSVTHYISQHIQICHELTNQQMIKRQLPDAEIFWCYAAENLKQTHWYFFYKDLWICAQLRGPSTGFSIYVRRAVKWTLYYLCRNFANKQYYLW